MVFLCPLEKCQLLLLYRRKTSATAPYTVCFSSQTTGYQQQASMTTVTSSYDVSGQPFWLLIRPRGRQTAATSESEKPSLNVSLSCLAAPQPTQTFAAPEGSRSFCVPRDVSDAIYLPAASIQIFLFQDIRISATGTPSHICEPLQCYILSHGFMAATNDT